jgi:hypothetical protein
MCIRTRTLHKNTNIVSTPIWIMSSGGRRAAATPESQHHTASHLASRADASSRASSRTASVCVIEQAEDTWTHQTAAEDKRRNPPMYSDQGARRLHPPPFIIFISSTSIGVIVKSTTVITARHISHHHGSRTPTFSSAARARWLKPVLSFSRLEIRLLSSCTTQTRTSSSLLAEIALGRPLTTGWFLKILASNLRGRVSHVAVYASLRAHLDGLGAGLLPIVKRLRRILHRSPRQRHDSSRVRRVT